MITMHCPIDTALRDLQIPSVGSAMTPTACKDLAVLIARRGVGKVAPNPLVGCVIVDAQGRFLAAGAHAQVGQNHAEINAIEQALAAGLSLAGATLYVTLEPCAHHSRTPACAPRVAASGVAKVIYGQLDPNPRVNGRGHQILADAGVHTAFDAAWAPACSELAAVFLWTIRQPTPFVGLKVALGLDGTMALPGDQRAWITGPRARAYGHFLRVCYDALVIGRGTLLADDPILDTRDAAWPGRAPRRVVLDPDAAGLLAKRPAEWRLLGHEPGGVYWVTGEKLARAAQARIAELTAMGGHWIALPVDSHGHFAPAALLAALAGQGVTSVLLEGGAGVYLPFLKAQEVNRLHLFQAPKVLGAVDGVHFAAGAGELDAVGDVRLTALERDWLLEMDLQRREH